MLRFIFKIWIRILGWEFVGEFPEALTRCVFVIGPHTSMNDYILIQANQKIRGFKWKFFVPEEEYKFPYNLFQKSSCGIKYTPVDTKQFESLKNELINNKECRLAFIPEMTLERNEDWDLTFYDLAAASDVPIVLLALDYKRKWIKYHIPFRVSIDKERDLEFIRRFYSTCVPRYPEKGIFKN